MLEEQVHQPSDTGADTYAGCVGAAPMGQTDRQTPGRCFTAYPTDIASVLIRLFWSEIPQATSIQRYYDSPKALGFKAASKCIDAAYCYTRSVVCLLATIVNTAERLSY